MRALQALICVLVTIWSQVLLNNGFKSLLVNSDMREVSIDPGFVNERLCLSFMGPQVLNQLASRFPILLQVTDTLFANGKYVFLSDSVVTKCKEQHTQTLAYVLHDLQLGTVFSSIERVTRQVVDWKAERLQLKIEHDYDGREIILEFDPQHIVGSTMRTILALGEPISIIARVQNFDEQQVIVHPIVMGAPIIARKSTRRELDYSVTWPGATDYEIHAEDIAEFSACKDVEVPAREVWQAYMMQLPEAEVKARFAAILGDATSKDWGGEQADHFTAAIHVGGEQRTAAFLLKGPARFEPMTLKSNLGKANDQLLRLATIDADLLIVQHAHEIDHKVRHVLAALARYAYRPRFYCFIEGRDTYRILAVYNKL